MQSNVTAVILLFHISTKGIEINTYFPLRDKQPTVSHHMGSSCSNTNRNSESSIAAAQATSVSEDLASKTSYASLTESNAPAAKSSSATVSEMTFVAMSSSNGGLSKNGTQVQSHRSISVSRNPLTAGARTSQTAHPRSNFNASQQGPPVLLLGHHSQLDDPRAQLNPFRVVAGSASTCNPQQQQNAKPLDNKNATDDASQDRHGTPRSATPRTPTYPSGAGCDFLAGAQDPVAFFDGFLQSAEVDDPASWLSDIRSAGEKQTIVDPTSDETLSRSVSTLTSCRAVEDAPLQQPSLQQVSLSGGRHSTATSPRAHHGAPQATSSRALGDGGMSASGGVLDPFLNPPQWDQMSLSDRRSSTKAMITKLRQEVQQQQQDTQLRAKGWRRGGAGKQESGGSAVSSSASSRHRTKPTPSAAVDPAVVGKISFLQTDDSLSRTEEGEVSFSMDGF